MKIILNRRCGASGIVWLILMLIWICVVIGLGIVLWKAVKRIKLPSIPDGDAAAMTASNEIAMASAELLATNPGMQILSTNASWTYGFEPFPAVEVPTIVYRSTNLIDWEAVVSLQANEQWADTNVFPQAFYYTIQVDGSPAPASTNFVPQFILIQ